LPEGLNKRCFMKKVSNEVIKKGTNTMKRDFCLNVKSKLEKIRINELRSLANQLQTQLNKISNYKASFYCFLCDSDKQNYIDPFKKTLTYDSQFCRSLLI